MAIGTITITNQGGQKPSAPLFVFDLTFVGDASYPTGGTADFEGSVQAKVGQTVEVLGVIDGGCGLYVPVYDKANDKLMCFVRTTGLEVGAAVDLHGTTFHVVVLAK